MAKKKAVQQTATYKRGLCSNIPVGEGVVVTERQRAYPASVACSRDTFVGVCVRTDAKRRTVTVRIGARNA